MFALVNSLSRIQPSSQPSPSRAAPQARVPKGRGLWPAIFMLPSKGEPEQNTANLQAMVTPSILVDV